MFQFLKRCIRDMSHDSRGPVAYHFYFPGENGGDWLLDRAQKEVDNPCRVHSLNAYAAAELLGRFGITEVPALVIVDNDRELLHLEGDPLSERPTQIIRKNKLGLCG